MRRRHLGRDKELEVFIVVDHLITELNENLRTLLLDLLGKNRVKHGIECLCSILKDDWVTVLDTNFKATRHNIGGHGRFDNREIGIAFLLLLVLSLQPLVSLHLRVDHKRPPLRVIENNCVLDRELVRGQAARGPLHDLDLLTQDLCQIDIL